MKSIIRACTSIFIVLNMVGVTYAHKDYKDIGNELYTFQDSITIHEAAKIGSLEKVKAFLANGEKVDVTDKHGMTPLYYAAANGHKDICELLISQGADVNAGREIGFTPLTAALNNRTESGVEIFKLLVDRGADININVGGYTLLHQAVNSCHNEHVRNIAEFLISKGVDINVKGYQDKTPLHMVGCMELARLLISKGADVNAKDNRGWTPLRQMHSQTPRKTEICDLLKKHGGIE